MNWKDLAGPLIRLGAPTIGGILAGPAGSRIGGTVGSVLADVLDVPATPAAVSDAIAAKPDLVPDIEAAHGGELIRAARAQQAALFATEDARGWFHHAWRPALSWLLIGLWLWNAVLIRVFIAFGADIAPIPWEQLVAFSGLWLAIYGGGHTVKSIWGGR